MTHRVAVRAQGAGNVKQNGGLNAYFPKLRVAYFVLQRETV